MISKKYRLVSHRQEDKFIWNPTDPLCLSCYFFYNITSIFDNVDIYDLILKLKCFMSGSRSRGLCGVKSSKGYFWVD